jgi:hypothetical protein
MRHRFPDATIAMFDFYIEGLKNGATANWLAAYIGLRNFTTTTESYNDRTIDPEKLKDTIEWIKTSPAIPPHALVGSPWILERCLEALGRALVAFDAVAGATQRLDLAVRLWETVQPLRHTSFISADFLHAALHIATVANEEAAASLDLVRMCYNRLSKGVSRHSTDGSASPISRDGAGETAVVLYIAGKSNPRISNHSIGHQGKSGMETDEDHDTDGGVPLY